jgi:hypothetical protein
MRFVKSALMGTGALALAALLLSLLAPKAAHAIVATLVQVVNTTANPAITQDTSKQASQIVTLDCTPIASTPPGAVSCVQVDAQSFRSVAQYEVPAASRFILTSLEYDPRGSSTTAGYFRILDLASPACCAASFEDIQLNNGNTPVSYQFSPGIVMEGTARPAILNDGFIPPGTSDIYLHGYLTTN